MREIILKALISGLKKACATGYTDFQDEPDVNGPIDATIDATLDLLVVVDEIVNAIDQAHE